ncbi:MAG: PAS domain-containing sensor histidine kinase [candidate division FCPU426 bacterium]
MDKEKVKASQTQLPPIPPAEAMWQLLFQSQIVGVFVFEMSGRIVAANDRFLKLMEYTAADLAAGKVSWLKLTSPRLVKKAHDARKILLEKRQAGPWEVSYTTHQGERRMAVFTAMLLPGQETGLGIMTDLTEFKKTEEGRRHFMLSMSHELRSPMTNVLCFLQLLDKSRNMTAQDREYLGVAHRNAQRLATLINSTMEMGKLEFVPGPPHSHLVDLRMVLERVCAALAPQAKTKGLSLINESPADGDCTLAGNEERMEQMISNLLVNALKYTEQGEVRVSVRLETSQDLVEFRVEDTGIGIPEEEQKRIFEPFYRVPGNHTRQTEGVGLGLRTVKTVVEQHGGRISLQSRLGQGSRFTILLPKGPAPQGAENR